MKTSLPILVILSMLALSQRVMAADYTIDTDVTTTNGGNTLDGDDSLTIKKSGSITPVSGDHAIDAEGHNNTIKNHGSIDTTGDDDEAIELNNYGVVTNTGFISTLGNTANGIVTWHNSTITNTGTISTAGTGAHAIDVQNDSIINNTGSIATTGQSADAIHTWDNSNVINTGVISTLDQDSIGIAVEDDSTVTNKGSISTQGADGYGIHADGSNNTIVNNGSISTMGNDGYGIFLEGASNNATNTGTITTIGVDAEAIQVEGGSNTVVNTGVIKTTGESSAGFLVRQDNNTISNMGTISVTGKDSYGIEFRNDSNTVNNAGLISATGTGTYYAIGMRDNSTLNLLAGSRIIGPVDLDDSATDANDTVNIYGGSPSAQTTFTGADTINLYGAGIVNGTTVTTVDATAPTALGLASANLSNSVHGTINRRMAYKPPLQPVQVASLTLSPGMLFQERKPAGWAQAFGGMRAHDADGDVMAYGHSHYGANIGYEWDHSKSRMGLMAGFARSDVESDITSFDTDSNNFFVGGYGHFNFGEVNLTASLIGGYSDYDNKRFVFDNINGLETASSDFDSTFLSPSVTLSAGYLIKGDYELRPSFNLAYNVAWMDGYSESGTTSSNLTIEDTTTRTLTTRLQLAVAKQSDPHSEVEMRVGLTSRHSDNDNTQAVLAGNSFSFASAGDDNDIGGYVGFNYRIATKDNLSLIADVEAGISDDEKYLDGQLSLEYTF